MVLSKPIAAPSDSTIDRAPTRDDVVYLYALLLQREPSEAAIDRCLKHATLQHLLAEFLAAPEFHQKHLNSWPGVDANKPAPPLTPRKPIAHPDETVRILAEQLAARHESGELYQPIFGHGGDISNPIQRECVERCRMVLGALAEHDVRDMTLVDVGSNMGFNTFYLAQHFHDVTGIEYEPALFDFSVALKAHLKSKASFKKTDFFSTFETMAYDVCLMFSVVHYLVAQRGIDAAIKHLDRIVNAFDFTIIELSSSRDYPYMPDDGSDILKGLTNVSMTRLGISEKNERPIYLLQRQSLPFGAKRDFKQIVLKPPFETSATRLYFYDDCVTKVLPFPGYADNARKFDKEFEAYRRLAGAPFAPALLDRGRTTTHGWLTLERLAGTQLNMLYEEQAEIAEDEKETIACKLIVTVAEMLRRGVYWNDLSAHNVLISEDSLRILDFGESSNREAHDHIAMMSWILHDLKAWSPRSYQSDIYQTIHLAEMRRGAFVANRFNADDSATYFGPSLAWIYDWMVKAPSLKAALGQRALLQRARTIAERKLTLAPKGVA